jgi:predicted ATPase/tetratricopeptide (TPR) repeat protein
VPGQFALLYGKQWVDYRRNADIGVGIQARLPEEPDTFIGRETELGELRRLLASTRVLTLRGLGGIGKTRLALRLLAGVADAFPDGTWLVELADLRQPELVVPRVASVLGVSEEPGRPLIETLTRALGSRRFLLALDNCELLPEACASLCRRLLASSAGAQLMIISRVSLHITGETIWEVPPLSVAPAGEHPVPDDELGSDAVRLFAERAAASRPGFTVGPDNVRAISSICRGLDGLPLAIELAAAWVRILSVEQILSRLDDGLGLLTVDDRFAQPRQRTLRAAIDWSHDLLPDHEAVLFRRLSVFTGWSLEMAEQVCSDDTVPAGDVLELTAALVDKSLVLAEPEAAGQARYRMLDTIREYAAERLARAGEYAAFHVRLRDYILRTAEDHLAIGMAGTPVPWSIRVGCSRRYDADSGNVSQVLDWCLAHADAETGMRICVAVSPRWLAWGTFAEGGEWLDSFLALDISAVAMQVRGAVLVARAQIALSSDPVGARIWARDGLALCCAAGDHSWTAAALNVLSEIALHTGQLGEAVARADEALAFARAAGDGWNEGYALGTRAAIAATEGKLREAQQLAAASVTVMRRIDQQWGVARALLGLGDVARVQGRPGEAHGQYMEALAILQQIGARPEMARCLAGLGRVAMVLGGAGQARRHLTQSIELSQAIGTRIGIARGLEAFAALAGYEKLPERAVQLTAAATALRQSAGLPLLPAARTLPVLAAAQHLGEPAFTRLWAQGLAMSGEAAVALAVSQPEDTVQDGHTSPLTAVATIDQKPDLMFPAGNEREAQLGRSRPRRICRCSPGSTRSPGPIWTRRCWHHGRWSPMK